MALTIGPNELGDNRGVTDADDSRPSVNTHKDACYYSARVCVCVCARAQQANLRGFVAYKERKKITVAPFSGFQLLLLLLIASRNNSRRSYTTLAARLIYVCCERFDYLLGWYARCVGARSHRAKSGTTPNCRRAAAAVHAPSFCRTIPLPLNGYPSSPLIQHPA